MSHSSPPASGTPVPTVGPDGRPRFRQVIESSAGELLFFGLTPPRLTTPAERLPVIAEATLARLEGIGLDAIILYDLADETARNPAERPFPFSETWDPDRYLRTYLSAWQGQSVVYRSVGKYDSGQLSGFLDACEPDMATVFVGSAAPEQPVKTTLGQAYEIYGRSGARVPLGGVTIPERHRLLGDEHERLLGKQRAGCSFFVSQVVYDVSEAKNLASDYAYALADAAAAGQPVPAAPLVFTLSLCGSAKSMEFLRWLGVDVPRWVSNEILHAHDPLEVSMDFALGAARQLARLCRHLGLPFGFNVESVSSRKAEIEASVQLARAVAGELQRPGIWPAAGSDRGDCGDGSGTGGCCGGPARQPDIYGS